MGKLSNLYRLYENAGNVLFSHKKGVIREWFSSGIIGRLILVNLLIMLLSACTERQFTSEKQVASNRFNEEQINAFRFAKKIGIVVSQSYEGVSDDSLPFEEVVQRLFENAGINIIKRHDSNYDITIEINAKGKGEGGGSTVNGTILIKIPGMSGVIKSFKGSCYKPWRAAVVRRNYLDDELIFGSISPKSELSDSFAAKIFEIIGEVYGFNLLINALNDMDSNIRTAAIEALSFFGNEDIIIRLIRLLKDDKEYNVGQAVVGALIRIGPPAIKHIIIALNDDDRDVRRGAVDALSVMKESQIVEPLIAALKDKDAYVRCSAAVGLSEIKDPRSVEYMIIVLSDENRDVQNCIESGLIKITGENYGKDLEKWRQWWSQNKNSFPKK